MLASLHLNIYNPIVSENSTGLRILHIEFLDEALMNGMAFS